MISCISFCVGKQAAKISRDLNLFKIESPKNSNQISNQTAIFGIESLQFEPNLQMCSNRDLNPNRDWDLPRLGFAHHWYLQTKKSPAMQHNVTK